MNYLTKIILKNVPGAQFALGGNDYDGLNWLDARTKPTAEEVQAWIDYENSPEAIRAKLESDYIDKINRDADNQIRAGCTSSALGAAHVYSGDLDTVTNITDLMIAGIDSYFTCTDAAGIKSRKLHTYAQIVQVFTDGMNRKKIILDERDAIKGTIASMTDAELEEALK
jgi:hypothetical protein